MARILFYTCKLELVELLKREIIEFEIFDVSRYKNPISAIRRYGVDVNIFNLSGITRELVRQIEYNFPTIPAIGILSAYDLETARTCGELGVDLVIHLNDLHTLRDHLFDLRGKTLRPRLIDFNLPIRTDSGLLSKALDIIEEDFVEIMSSQEIASRLGVTDVTLSRRFNKIGIGVKRLLMLFKVKYASELMKNQGFSLNEIASISGFTSFKRMNECYRRVYGLSPTKYRQIVLKPQTKKIYEARADIRY